MSQCAKFFLWRYSNPFATCSIISRRSPGNILVFYLLTSMILSRLFLSVYFTTRKYISGSYWTGLELATQHKFLLMFFVFYSNLWDFCFSQDCWAKVVKGSSFYSLKALRFQVRAPWVTIGMKFEQSTLGKWHPSHIFEMKGWII